MSPQGKSQARAEGSNRHPAVDGEAPRMEELAGRLRYLDEHVRELERELGLERAELARTRAQLDAQESRSEALAADVARARSLDAVSGLPNRAAFVELLESALPSLLQAGDPAAVLVVGIDRLSSLRESLGFDTADRVARRIGERLQETLDDFASPDASSARPAGRRRAGTGHPPTRAVARVGDDEFAIAVSSPTRAADWTQALARRLIEVIDGPMRVADTDLRLMATIGVAIVPKDGTRAEVLLASAQAAMRFARERGTHELEFFRVSIGREGERRLRLEAELRRGIDQQEFSVHYQPRVQLRGRRIVGVEALLRWNHPERGLLAAVDFIDVAVETGLITPIGEAVLRQACRDAAPWPETIGLSVNLSAREFRGTRLEGIVDRALEESGLAPQRLSVELGEDSLQGQEADIALVRLTALRERGMQLTLDHYGAGRGGLDLLRRCRADFVKISPQLVATIDVDADAFAIVRAIVSLARHFGSAVVAQGIERESQVEAALRAGCLQGQGYLLGPTLRPEELRELLGKPGRGARAPAG